MIRGTPKFDALAIGKIEIDFFRNPVHIEATAGFVSSTTGDTHGYTRTEGAVWSERTRATMRELRRLMEDDIAKIHFSSSETPEQQRGLDLGGIGEHVGSVNEATPDATSVDAEPA